MELTIRRCEKETKIISKRFCRCEFDKKSIFQKGYEQNWSKELFIIQKALPGNPLYYRLKDVNGE